MNKDGECGVYENMYLDSYTYTYRRYRRYRTVGRYRRYQVLLYRSTGFIGTVGTYDGLSLFPDIKLMKIETRLNAAATSFWKLYHRGLRKEHATVAMIRAVDAAWQDIRDVLLTTGLNARHILSYFAALIFTSIPHGFTSLARLCLRTNFATREEERAQRNRNDYVLALNNSFALFWRQIHDLGWFHYFEDIFDDAFYEGVREYVKNTCSGCYDEPTFMKVDSWKHTILFPWLRSVRCYSNLQERLLLQAFGSLFVDEAYVDSRMSEMYDIITEFPESSSAVFDLKGPLSRTRRHRRLAHSVHATLQHRLLHPGANTSQIMDVYISTVKVLGMLDPLGLLLDTAARSVREYLKKRNDTVHCVVASLTDELDGELYQELHQTNLVQSESCIEPDSSAKTSSCELKLLPLLVSIYGSTKVFVNEYRFILCNKYVAVARVHDHASICKSAGCSDVHPAIL